jgi:hypothetical protein
MSVFGMKAGAYTLVEHHAKLNPRSYYYAFEHQGFWSTYDMSAESIIPGGTAHWFLISYSTYPYQKVQQDPAHKKPQNMLLCRILLASFPG